MFSRLNTRHRLLRIILALIICSSFLPLTNLSWIVRVGAQGQSAGRAARPRPGKPEGTLPDLDEVQRESQLEREPVAPIPSTMRSKKNSGKPWDGRRVGDPFDNRADNNPAMQARNQTRHDTHAGE